ncbi:hypothetical protein LIER_12993 [Lithospermum erythrorhizon]|uniref:Reverse transcriptase Ty1/copia-type domain-containing protein n=1 Tax=Lithospermum erythrorhizon TaxID=34254 RepID=A0AAV3PVS3_LITER
MWSWKKVNLSFLRVFGCLAYVHVDANTRSKLDTKSNICYFIGYDDVDMGYRFYDLKNRKIIRSKDVIFNEEVLYKDRQKVLEEKEVEEEVTAEIPRKSNAQDKAHDSVSSKWHILDHTLAPESKPEDPFADMPPLEEAGTIEEEITVVEEDTSDNIQEVEILGPRRSERASRPTQRYSPSANFLLLNDKGKPVSYDEVVQCDDSIKWELAIKEEMESLMTNMTWDLVKPPGRQKRVLQNKWAYRIKEEHDVSKRYRAQLVVKEFQQKEGIDYTEIFSPVVKLVTIRTVLGFIERDNLHLQQMDVKTAFLLGDLDEKYS